MSQSPYLIHIVTTLYFQNLIIASLWFPKTLQWTRTATMGPTKILLGRTGAIVASVLARCLSSLDFSVGGQRNRTSRDVFIFQPVIRPDDIGAIRHLCISLIFPSLYSTFSHSFHLPARHDIPLYRNIRRRSHFSRPQSQEKPSPR